MELILLALCRAVSRTSRWLSPPLSPPPVTSLNVVGSLHSLGSALHTYLQPYRAGGGAPSRLLFGRGVVIYLSPLPLVALPRTYCRWCDAARALPAGA